MPFSFDLSESAPGAGNPSRGSSSENAAGQRSSVMPFSFDLSESASGAGNPSRGLPPGSVRRSCPSPSIYRNPRPAREIRPAGRRRAAFVGHALLLRSIGIRVRRGKSVPRAAAGRRSSVMAFPSQCGSKSDKYREISPRGAKNLLFSGRNLRFSIKIYMF